jgi:hypothetical protein
MSDTINGHEEALCKVYDFLKKVEDTPLKSHFFAKITKYKSRCELWIAKSNVKNETAPLNIKSDFEKLKKFYECHWRALCKDKRMEEFQAAFKRTNAQNSAKINALEQHVKKVELSKNVLDRKIDILTRRLRRYKTERAKFMGTMSKIGKMGIFNPNIMQKLQSQLSKPSFAFLRRLGSQSVENANRQEKFAPDEREFVLTIHFYSPKVFRFLSKSFIGAFPTEQTIRSWIRADRTEVGFNQPSLDVIRALATKFKEENKQLYIALSCDDMYIKKHIDFVGGKIWGYSDFGKKEAGKPLVDIEAKPALNAHMFMACAINGNLKKPVGLFFISSLKAPDRAALTKECIIKIEETGAKVISLTFDGTTTNISMANILGANLQDVRCLKHYFPNPFDTSRSVYIILDACHMIKLVRNIFGSKALFDADGEKIDFTYIVELFLFQERRGLHFANKLKKTHIYFHKAKMKVCYAVQLLSDSVADALEFLMLKGHEKFQGAGATIKFIRIFNNLFDRCNAKSPIKRHGKKARLERTNEKEWKRLFATAKEYILGLQIMRKNFQRCKLLESQSKTGFFGFIVCMKSIESIFEEYIKDFENNPTMLNYLLPYKLSQDHLEMFFGALRQKGGFNDNPTARNLFTAYKCINLKVNFRLSENANIRDVTEPSVFDALKTNCKAQQTSDFKFTGVEDVHFECLEDVDLLLDFGAEIQPRTESVKTTNAVSAANFEHDYEMDPDGINDIIGYVAGYLARSYKIGDVCNECTRFLCDSEVDGGMPGCALIEHKNRPEAKYGLVQPSQDVYKICFLTDICINEVKRSNLNSILAAYIPSRVAEILSTRDIFRSGRAHLMADHGPAYIESLIEEISCRYQKSVVNNLIKLENTSEVSERSSKHKIIHFSGM